MEGNRTYNMKPINIEGQASTDPNAAAAEGAMQGAAASGGNPYAIAGMVGLKALQAYKQRKEMERQERYRAQVDTSNRMQRSLAQLSNIGRALKL